MRVWVGGMDTKLLTFWLVLYVEVVVARPPDHSTLCKGVPPAQAVHEQVKEEEEGEESNELWEFTHNVEGLMFGVVSMHLDDVPQHLQRNTVGIHSSWHNGILHRIVYIVMCYH